MSARRCCAFFLVLLPAMIKANCKNWCEGHAAPDATKCNWVNCNSCAACEAVNCVDNEAPLENWAITTCAEHYEKGNCQQDWFRNKGFCRKTCGQCEAVLQSQCYEVFEVDEQWGTRYSTGYSQIRNPHYSGMVAAVHNSQYSMLEIGGNATPGVKQISEFGNGRRLSDEIIQAKPNTLDPLHYGLTIGATNIKLGEATLDSNHTYVSMIAMIAPSPDWSIYGHANLAPNGAFVDSLDVDMHLIDAGSCDIPGVDGFAFCGGRHGTTEPIFYRKSPITGPGVGDDEKRLFMKIRFKKASCDGRRLSATRSGLTVEVMV